MTKIEVQGLGKVYQGEGRRVEALRDVSLTVEDGEFLCIIGPSGCGKSTLLRILAGLYKQTSGTVRVKTNGSGPAVNAMVFQEYAIFPWRTTIENVAFGLEMRGWPADARMEVAHHYLAKVGLSEFAHQYPYQLSGGMKQRVALARALATDPEILLMDEPFGALDAQTRLILQEELLRIWEEERKTVVYVTHSIDEAILLGDRVVVITARPGRVKTHLTVDLPRPRPSRVRTSVRFNELAEDLWSHLADEVRSGELMRAS